MTNKTTRRDFLNGTRVAIGASLVSPWTNAFGRDVKNFQLPPGYYPPAETGLRGQPRRCLANDACARCGWPVADIRDR